ncbi:hypothetical protein ACS0TY_029686 [Phlomoides rotata]
MIIEDERDEEAPITDYREAPATKVKILHDQLARFEEFLARHSQIKNKSTHFALCYALIDHLWKVYIILIHSSICVI